MSWISNGRLYDRYTGIDGKSHKVSVAYPKDTPQAHRKAEKELSALISSKLSLISKKSLNEALEDYFNHKDVKPTTLANEKCSLGVASRIIGDISVSSLTAPYIKRKLSESGKSVSTLNRYIVLLNSFLKWCHEFGYISDPIRLSPFPVKQVKVDVADLYLEHDELSDILDKLDGTMEGYICRFLVLTGCRIGEAAALDLEDIDEYIHIRKTTTFLNNIQTPKTVSSERDIFIQPELRALLREYYDWRRLYMMSKGVRTNMLFFSTVGGRYQSQTLRKILQQISPKAHPHIFRHTHVALLAEQGIPLETIARRLGHTDTKTTRGVYFHVTEKLRDRENEMLSKVSIL